MLIYIFLAFSFWKPDFNTLTHSSEITTDKPVNKGTTYINWSSNRKLTWDDFQKEADPSEPLHAMASTNISVQANCEGNVMKFNVQCQFAPTDSWSKNKSSESLLQHEQLHFDITEVYARLLRQKLEQQKSLCNSDKRKFTAVVNKVFADWKKAQQQYDSESDHGLDSIKQQQWTAEVASKLLLLQTYATKNDLAVN